MLGGENMCLKELCAQEVLIVTKMPDLKNAKNAKMFASLMLKINPCNRSGIRL
jgi:hypothetical protein